MSVTTAKITFLPGNRSIDVRRGRTLLDVSKEHLVGIPYDCDSKCVCGICYVIVEQGTENLSPVHEVEASHLRRQNLAPSARLSCQAAVLGDVVVRLPERRL
ncbi:MAG TPA: 2Fe-2S iron-sulfur cluster-binding protein [Bdellovibrionota bacterium]|nr:2Fe-2S iron-sulfur cluster-binding protein [Bdellovibrionota bacterium]